MQKSAHNPEEHEKHLEILAEKAATELEEGLGSIELEFGLAPEMPEELRQGRHARLVSYCLERYKQTTSKEK